MNELELLKFQIDSYNRSVLEIIKHLNERINVLENEVEELRENVTRNPYQ